ncbi:MAG: RnfABCDGE type electron transport complex subunit D, partial [Candidatus Omnitrophica bacterium]|nr:RnfABCDGE type electron transport complex subunit D [Candidatus Omnitrophota bacterium]
KLIIYLACFAVFLAIKDNDLVFLTKTLIAVISALAAEAFVSYLKSKKAQLTESAVITGLIIGFVLNSGQPWFYFVFASAAAIISRYLIRYQNRPVFNPAALGIFLSVLLLGAFTQWRGTYLWHIIIPLGFYFVYKLRKAEVIVGYTIVFFVLFGAQALLFRSPFLGILGYLSYFYIFVMVIEPKTSPTKKLVKYLFGAGVAVVIFILNNVGGKFEVELLGLLFMNGATTMLNMKRGTNYA